MHESIPSTTTPLTLRLAALAPRLAYRCLPGRLLFGRAAGVHQTRHAPG